MAPALLRDARLRALTILSTLSVAAVCASSVAHAEEPGPRITPVAVLGIDSDDAEEQADALTSTLRSRVRASPGWSLGDATQPLGMLTAALKCPPHPDGTCEQHISEQIKLDNFVWGVMRKAPGGKVSVELHLYSKGKPSQVATTSYAENLKDQNDDSLRREAQTLITKLQGSVVGSVTIHSNTPEGDVTIDGARHEALKAGSIHLDLATGSHTFEVSSPGYPPQKTTINVVAGHDTMFEPSFGSIKPEVPKTLPTRKIVGVGSLVLGAGAGVASVVMALNYVSISNQQSDLLKSVPTGGDACALQASHPVTLTSAQYTDVSTACQYHNNHDGDAKLDSTLGIVFGGAAAVGIGVGIYLLFVDKGDGEQSSPPDAPTTSLLKNVHVIPGVGPNGGTMLLTGAF
jgi:hypothetical protein